MSVIVQLIPSRLSYKFDSYFLWMRWCRTEVLCNLTWTRANTTLSCGCSSVNCHYEGGHSFLCLWVYHAFLDKLQWKKQNYKRLSKLSFTTFINTAIYQLLDITWGQYLVGIVLHVPEQGPAIVRSWQWCWFYVVATGLFKNHCTKKKQ